MTSYLRTRPLALAAQGISSCAGLGLLLLLASGWTFSAPQQAALLLLCLTCVHSSSLRPLCLLTAAGPVGCHILVSSLVLVVGLLAHGLSLPFPALLCSYSWSTGSGHLPAPAWPAEAHGEPGGGQRAEGRSPPLCLGHFLPVTLSPPWHQLLSVPLGFPLLQARGGFLPWPLGHLTINYLGSRPLCYQCDHCPGKIPVVNVSCGFCWPGWALCFTFYFHFCLGRDPSCCLLLAPPLLPHP